MKVIALNGSPKKDGNTACALRLMAEELKKDGIETEVIDIGHLTIHGCTACGYCASSENNECIFKDDLVNETAAKIREADGFILASPTYYAGVAGTMKSFLDRLFYSSSSHFKYKVATAVTAVRRTGGIDTLHQLNNYLALAQTVTPPSQYWTVVYGRSEGEMMQDLEGVQTIQKNARAMAWLIKVISEGKKNIPMPPEEKRVITNFIR
ncbi:MAG: flavodoxin family protein [Synergistaceae bacterium]|nr:flavodoxin family protein [Synergistaceae bacterium]